MLKGTKFATECNWATRTGEERMKRDTQQRPGVSKSAAVAPIGDPRSAVPGPKQGLSAVTVTTSVTLSARYIDSRLKQFCCR